MRFGKAVFGTPLPVPGGKGNQHAHPTQRMSTRTHARTRTKGETPVCRKAQPSTETRQAATRKKQRRLSAFRALKKEKTTHTHEHTHTHTHTGRDHMSAIRNRRLHIRPGCHHQEIRLWLLHRLHPINRHRNSMVSWGGCLGGRCCFVAALQLHWCPECLAGSCQKWRLLFS